MKIKAFALILAYTVSAFLFSTQALAVTGDVIVTQSGQSVPGATVKIETAEGDSIGETRTDFQGRAKLNLSEGAINKPEVVKVTEANGNTTTYKFPVRVSSMPDKSFEIPSESLSLVSLDLDGGISVFDKDVISAIEKAALPVNVGDNSAVGTGARVKQKIMKQAGVCLAVLWEALAKECLVAEAVMIQRPKSRNYPKTLSLKILSVPSPILQPAQKSGLVGR